MSRLATPIVLARVYAYVGDPDDLNDRETLYLSLPLTEEMGGQVLVRRVDMQLVFDSFDRNQTIRAEVPYTILSGGRP